MYIKVKVTLSFLILLNVSLYYEWERYFASYYLSLLHNLTPNLITGERSTFEIE